MSYRILAGKVEQFCRHYKGERFHACLCDAPYEMAFMNRDWDSSGVSFNPDTWAGISNLLLPGAFLFIFAGTINSDLISVAMRKAGLRKHHEMLGWVNGSGFPKATRIDTQIDQAAGKMDEREIIGQYQPPNGQEWNLRQANDGKVKAAPGAFTASGRRTLDIERAATPLAQSWQGHRYGGQVFKPSIETVLVFQKPYEGKPVDCITETGAGAVWIDGGRVATGGNIITTHSRGSNRAYPKRPGETTPEESGRKQRQDLVDANPRQGRWPPNFYLQHMPECVQVGTTKVKGSRIEKPCEYEGSVGMFGNAGDRPARGIGDSDGMETVADWQCHPDCPVRKLGEQSGERENGYRPNQSGAESVSLFGHRIQGEKPYNDTGTASRFFYQSHWMYERLEQSDPIYYTGKATRKERDAGLDDLPLRTRNRVNPGGLENEPRWSPVKMHNPHPAVKPIALTKWLATLLLPPLEYAPRRLLVPFAGSGSEMIGALLAGWEEVVGIELLRENVTVARARIAWWQKWVEMGCNDVGTILGDGIALEQDTPIEQLEMF